jgi:Chalcone isomerase-like
MRALSVLLLAVALLPSAARGRRPDPPPPPSIVASAALQDSAASATLAGVAMPRSRQLGGQALTLNGMALRKKAIFKVYVAGLYVENPSKDASALLSSSEAKQMHLWMLRDIKGANVSGAIADGFQLNSKAALPQLQPRLDQLAKMIPDMKEGDQMSLTFVPDKGTVVNVRGTDVGTIEGRDFADALFAVWLGPNPVQDDLKQALLGNAS